MPIDCSYGDTCNGKRRIIDGVSHQMDMECNNALSV